MLWKWYAFSNLFITILNLICVWTGNEQVQQRRKGLCGLFGLCDVCSIVHRNPWKNYQRSAVLKSENQIAKDPRGDNQRWMDRREKFKSVLESWGRSSSGA